MPASSNRVMASPHPPPVRYWMRRMARHPRGIPAPKHESRQVALKKEGGKKEAETAAHNQKDQAENQRKL